MKTKTSRLLKCFKYLVVFYLVFNCVLGICIAVFASYLFIFRQGSHIAKARTLVLCFLFVPATFTILLTTLGWSSIKRRSVSLLKCFVNKSTKGLAKHGGQFAVVLSVADILFIAGCLWCLTSLPQINEQTVNYMEEKFSKVTTDTTSETWWNEIQTKLKCCGLHGPTDYHLTKSVPFSCCGSDPDDKTKGSCSFLWQKGCSNALSKELSQDLLLLGLTGLGFVFLQIPAIFLTWCFANKLSKEQI